MDRKIMCLILMGVTGCGKTVIGEKLSQATGLRFIDGDSFHPEENKLKMRSGTPLTDADRFPWLRILRDVATEEVVNGKSVILGCSALKESYRAILREIPAQQVCFVHLYGSKETIEKRLADRVHEFMNPALLQTQLDTLEAPSDAFVVEVNKGIEEIVHEIMESHGLEKK